MHYGIDVSSNNPHPIDYPTVVAYLRQLGGGAQPFVIVKATQGTGYINPCFSEDIQGFAKAGAAVGAYLMDQGNTDPAAEEAAFRRVAGGLPQFDDDELPMGNNAYAQHCAALVAQQPAALDYLNQSEEDAGFPAGAGLWEANYNGQPGVTHRPAVLIHQYSSSGTLPGIAGPVDMNAWLGSEAQFAEVFHLTAETPTITASTEGELRMKLAKPIVCAIPRPQGDGGWLIAADGGTFPWGAANQHGNPTNATLAYPIVAAVAAADGNGYTLIGADGGTFPYGTGPKIPSLA